jgi:hypothetical protein
MTRITGALAALAALLLTAPAARADIWDEQGDAGELPGTAQVVFGLPSLEGIRGMLETANDVDMFAIRIVDPATFSATTVGTPGMVMDTQLFLFDATGRGVYANDDASTATSRSTLPAGNPNGPQVPGLYYLAISSFDRVPVSSPTNDLIFPGFPRTGVFGPTGPGGADPVTAWRGGGTEAGTYTILLTGSAAFFPEPSSLLLFGLGLAGAGAWYRRRRAAA